MDPVGGVSKTSNEPTLRMRIKSLFRSTSSLADFAKLVELFDEHQAARLIHAKQNGSIGRNSSSSAGRARKDHGRTWVPFCPTFERAPGLMEAPARLWRERARGLIAWSVCLEGTEPRT
jgi:hypothetical protein